MDPKHIFVEVTPSVDKPLVEKVLNEYIGQSINRLLLSRIKTELLNVLREEQFINYKIDVWYACTTCDGTGFYKGNSCKFCEGGRIKNV